MGEREIQSNWSSSYWDGESGDTLVDPVGSDAAKNSKYKVSVRAGADARAVAPYGCTLL